MSIRSLTVTLWPVCNMKWSLGQTIITFLNHEKVCSASWQILHYSAFQSSFLPLPLSPQSQMPILDKVFSIAAAAATAAPAATPEINLKFPSQVPYFNSFLPWVAFWYHCKFNINYHSVYLILNSVLFIGLGSSIKYVHIARQGVMQKCTK